MKKIHILIGLFITGTFLTSSLVPAFSSPLFTPIVVTFGNSKEVTEATSTFKSAYPNSIVFSSENLRDIRIANILTRSISPLIIIGHGSDTGLLSASGKEISWENLGIWINSLPTTNTFFIACNSENAKKFTNNPTFGFSGVVDGIVASLSVAAHLYQNNHDMLSVQHLIPQFMNRIASLFKGTPLLALTDKSESGYQIAAEKQYIYTGGWVCVPFTSLCTYVKYTEENIFWLNLDAAFAAPFSALIGLGIAGVTAVLKDLASDKPSGWAAKTLLTLGTDVIETVTYGSSSSLSVGPVTVTAGTMGFVVALLLFVCLIEIAWVFFHSQTSRVRNDVKIGLGAEYMPVPLFYMKGDNGADNYGDDGWTNLPFPIQGAVAVAVFGIPPYGPALATLAIASPYLFSALFALFPEQHWMGSYWIGK